MKLSKRNHLALTMMAVTSLIFQMPIHAIAAGGRAEQNTVSTTSTSTASTTEVTTQPSGLNTYNQTLNTSLTNSIVSQAEKDKANNAQNKGEEASSAQNMGMLAGLAGAAFSGAKAAQSCSSSPPKPDCPIWVAGAIASALVAGLMGAAKNKSDKTVTDVTTGSPGTETTPPVDSRLIETERNIAEIAKKAGINANARTGTMRMPDGRTLNVSDLGNSAALAAAGFSPSEIDAMQSAARTALREGEKIAKKGLDNTAGSAGESLSVAGGGSGSTEDQAATAGTGTGSGLQREPAQIAGLSRDYNGDRIGVASDNLFTLINRRYSHAAGQNAFLLPRGADSK